jgi:hypothetical protein
MDERGLVGPHERYYTLDEVGDIFHCSRKTAGRLVADEPGILRFRGHGGDGTRPRYSTRVPQSVLDRLIRRLRAR